jgi:hypothetical protein
MAVQPTWKAPANSLAYDVSVSRPHNERILIPRVAGKDLLTAKGRALRLKAGASASVTSRKPTVRQSSARRVSKRGAVEADDPRKVRYVRGREYRVDEFGHPGERRVGGGRAAESAGREHAHAGRRGPGRRHSGRHCDDAGEAEDAELGEHDGGGVDTKAKGELRGEAEVDDGDARRACVAFNWPNIRSAYCEGLRGSLRWRPHLQVVVLAVVAVIA